MGTMSRQEGKLPSSRVHMVSARRAAGPEKKTEDNAEYSTGKEHKEFISKYYF